MASSSRPQTPRANIPATDDQGVDLLEILQESRLRRPIRPSSSSSTLPRPPTPVILFCGADQEKTDADWDQRRPWAVQMLPESLLLAKETETEPAYKRQKRSNGCGARVHARATPDRRWRGLLEGVSADVVKLDSEYFLPDMKRELLLGKEHCGCSRSGVGCAICGNPLGALFKPCVRHAPSNSHYTFLPNHVSPPLPTSARRLSTADDVLSGRGEREREALQRRMRDREELTQLRARIRAAQQQNPRDFPPREPPPLPTFTTAVFRTVPEDTSGPSTTAPPPFSDFLSQEARDARRLRQEEARLAPLSMRSQDSSSTPRPWFFPPLPAHPLDTSTANPAEEQRAFEIWADETLERATATVAATAASAPDLDADAPSGTQGEGGGDLTVADLRAMFQGPRQRIQVGTGTGSGFTTPPPPSAPPTNLTQSEDERHLARLQRVETLFARTAAARMGTRTIERRTAVPDLPDDEEQEKEEVPRPRPFFER